VTAGLTYGVGAVSSSAFVSGAINGAVNSVVGQGVNIAWGLQDNFSWREVALSAAASGAANQVGDWLKVDPSLSKAAQRSQNFVRDLAMGATDAGVRMALGGKVDGVQVALDIFGNAIGNSVVSAISPKLLSTRAAGTAATEADELSEVQITAQRIRTDVSGYRLTNNPSNSIADARQIVSPDEARNGSQDALATVTISTDRWNDEKGEIYNRLRWGLFGLGAMEDEDSATWNAERLYDAGFRPLSRERDAAILLDGFSAYGHVKNGATGLWNLGVKVVGGLASLPALPFGVDNAVAVRDWVSRARINLDSPFGEMVGQSLAPSINRAQAWSEANIGVGGTIALGAAGEFTLDTLSLVGAGAGARRFLPELDVALDSRLTVGGAASSTKYNFRHNVDGPRSEHEALAIAEVNGVEIPDNVMFKYVDDALYEKYIVPKFGDSYASYGQFDNRALSSIVKWGHIAEDGIVSVAVRKSVLASDEAIVTILGHESHEIMLLKQAFSKNGWAMSFEKYDGLVKRQTVDMSTPHNLAEKHADTLLLDMRKRRTNYKGLE
jgi:hypothetical protein